MKIKIHVGAISEGRRKSKFRLWLFPALFGDSVGHALEGVRSAGLVADEVQGVGGVDAETGGARLSFRVW